MPHDDTLGQEVAAAGPPPKVQPLPPNHVATPIISSFWHVPYPGFGMALVWCLLFLIVTQFMPAVLVGVVIVGKLLIFPDSVAPAADTQTYLMNWIAMPAMLLSQVASIGFSLLMLRLLVGPEWSRQVGLRRPSRAHLVLTLLVFPSMVLLASGAFAVLKEFLPSLAQIFHVEGLPGMEEMVELFGTWPLPLAVLIIGVGPGLGEELWCRAFLGRGLVGRYGIVIGILLTSLLFGLIHVDPRQGTMAALMGVVLHYVYQTTRSLWMPMLLHFLVNSFSMVAANLGGGLQLLDQKPEAIPSIVYKGAGLLLAVVALALYQSRARLAARDGEPISWQPPFAGVAHPPEDSGLVVVRSRLSGTMLCLLAVAVIVFTATIYSGYLALQESAAAAAAFDR